MIIEEGHTKVKLHAKNGRVQKAKVIARCLQHDPLKRGGPGLPRTWLDSPFNAEGDYLWELGHSRSGCER